MWALARILGNHRQLGCTWLPNIPPRLHTAANSAPVAPYSRAIRRGSGGSSTPASTRASTAGPMPNRSAACSWVNPSRSRASRRA